MEWCEKLGGIGASEIGCLFTQQGVKARTAQTKALEKAIELITGERKSITTAAMSHGIYNEEEAYRKLVYPLYPECIYQPSLSFKISDGLWATPDVINPSSMWTCDIKCPYTITSYKGNIEKPKSYYIAQVQMQMLATGFDKGYLLFYLTSTAQDEWGNKIEFNIPIEKRHTWIEYKHDPDFHKEIVKRASDFFKVRDSIYKDLLVANEISDEEYYKLIFEKGMKATKLKDKSNYTAWGGKIFYNENEGYLVIEK